MLRNTYIIASLIMFTIVLSLIPVPCLAVVHGDVELLKTIALRNKANLESILTWKGEALEEWISKRGDSYDYMIRNKCIFAYDQLQDAIRWNKEPQENRFVVDGKSLHDINAEYNSAMIKAQSSYEYSGIGLKDGEVTHHLIIDQWKRAKNWGSQGLDPRYFFANSHSNTLHDKLMFLYESANDPNLHEWYVKREGDLVTLQVQSGVGNTDIQKYIFDLSIGGNLTEYYNKSKTAENIRKYEYEDKSGVWVLRSYKWMNTTHRADGDLISTRSINWSKSVVNVPFDEDEFTVEKLGLKSGDDIHDHVVGMRYTYKGALTDSELLESVDTANMPVSEMSSEGGSVPVPNDIDTAVTQHPGKEPNVAVQGEMLSETTPGTLDTDGTNTYAHAIVAAIVIGLAAIVYMLSRRLRRE